MRNRKRFLVLLFALCLLLPLLGALSASAEPQEEACWLVKYREPPDEAPFHVVTGSELERLLEENALIWYAPDEELPLIEPEPVRAPQTDGRLWHLEMIGAEAAWEAGYTGQGVRIGVVDSGIDPHPDFADQLVSGHNYIQDADDPEDTGDQLRKKIDSLRDFAYDKNIIDGDQWRRVNMIRMGSLGGNIGEWYLLTDAEEESTLFHTRDHVESRWVAGEDASLQAAFGPVSTARILENAVSQPAAQIAALGNNRFLVVFLDDDNARERQQASVLKWTVYDASLNTWTEPQTVQDDGTADGRANLIDGGDKLILSWPSVAADRYEALKQEVAAELKAETGVDPTDEQIQAELEKDPARVMMLQEIYSVEFGKSTETFGAITRLTDDVYYDDGPQAVYDAETGDYIVLYYKTAQDSEEYDTPEERLTDLVSSNADPNRTSTSSSTASPTIRPTCPSRWPERRQS